MKLLYRFVLVGAGSVDNMLRKRGSCLVYRRFINIDLITVLIDKSTIIHLLVVKRGFLLRQILFKTEA